MGSSDTPPAQRARTKTPDFSELFRSAHASRPTPRPTASGSSTTSYQVEKPAATKAPSRRSMLPFLGRKKPVEQPAVPAPLPSRKSVGHPSHPVTPVNTVRRSFGNGHAVLMITPSMNPPNRLPEPPLPSKLPSIDAHPPSFGSKLAAHFTPLRSPSRNSKARFSMIPNPHVTVPPLPSCPTTLSPLVPEIRAPSIESQHSACSRSTTPRPLREAPLTTAVNGDEEEDFSDLFTLPDQLKRPKQSPNSPSATSMHIYLGDSPRKSGELTPTTPVTPSGPSLQFPIPPSTGIPRSLLTEKGFPGYSSERASLSSQGSKGPSKRLSPGAVDSGGGRTLSSQDERRSSHHRTTSVSGSDTDTSRANDSTYSVPNFKLSHMFPRSSGMKHKLSESSITKASSGPPPSVPLPSPPVSPNPGSLVPRLKPSTSPDRVAFPRPRANTLSVTSNLAVPGTPIPKSNHSSPVRSTRVNSDVMPEVTIEELQGALSQQRRKNAQLQEYIGTITKRYEDDRTAMTKTIEKLERNIRKKMREIEGLRWLVIHNGAVSDIDAAANLARSSLSTQDGDVSDSVQRMTPLSSSPVIPQVPHHDGSPFHQSMPGQRAAGISAAAATSALGFSSDASISVASLSTSSVSETASLTTSSLSVIPERIDGITRAERQRLKEERRASKALRRISAVSTFTLATELLTQSSSPDSPLDPFFQPNQSMDEVMEKLQPFRHS